MGYDFYGIIMARVCIIIRGILNIPDSKHREVVGI